MSSRAVALQRLELFTVDADGVVCMDDIDVPCARRRIRARIVFGTDIGSAVPGDIVHVGKLTVALTAFEQTIDNGTCGNLVGGSEAAAAQDEIGAPEREADGVRELIAVIANDALEHDVDPERVELLGDE